MKRWLDAFEGQIRSDNRRVRELRAEFDSFLHEVPNQSIDDDGRIGDAINRIIEKLGTN